MGLLKGNNAPYDTFLFRSAARPKTAAPGYDIYALYDEWVSWWHDMGKPELKSPAGAFIGFCKKRHERKPMR